MYDCIVPGFCKDGWTCFRNNCYLFASEATSWEFAQAQCSIQGADLVKIHNSDENDFITKHWQVDTWIGLHKNDEETFVWTDGTEPRYFRAYCLPASSELANHLNCLSLQAELLTQQGINFPATIKLIIQ